MTRSGVPDYGMYAALENMGKLVDSGELAARLGSIVTFNREGNVVFWDDFEKTPLKWVDWTQNGVGSVVYTNETALLGGQCVKATTAAQNNSGAGIVRYLLLVDAGKVGLEIAFAPEDTNQSLYFLLEYDSGTYSMQGWMKFNCDTQTIELKDENSNWIEIATGMNFHMTKNIFHVFKMVIDLGVHKYERIIFDREEHNISEYKMRYWNSGYGKGLFSRINTITNNATAQTVYLDNFILTQNEP